MNQYIQPCLYNIIYTVMIILTTSFTIEAVKWPRSEATNEKDEFVQSE